MNVVGAQEIGLYGLWHQNGRFAESAKLHESLEVFASFCGSNHLKITPGEIVEQASFQ